MEQPIAEVKQLFSKAEVKVEEAKQAVAKAEKKVEKANQDVAKAEQAVKEAEQAVKEAGQDVDIKRESLIKTMGNKQDHNKQDAVTRNLARLACEQAEKKLQREEKKLQREEKKLQREEKTLQAEQEWLQTERASLRLDQESLRTLLDQFGKLALNVHERDDDDDKPGSLLTISKGKIFTPKKLTTPSKNDPQKSILKQNCIHIERSSPPLVVPPSGKPGTYQNPYSSELNPDLKEGSDDLSPLFAEKYFYTVASKFLPDWVEARPRQMDAKLNRRALFPKTSNTRRFLEFANFEQVLFTKVKEDRIPAPAYNGEIKSAGTGTVVLDEIANYVLFGIIHAFFGIIDNTSEKYRYFFEKPPIGYGLVAMAHVGYLVCLELVGKAIITPCSMPFFLGSSQHKETVRGLQSFDYEQPIALDCEQPILRMCPIKRDGIFYTKLCTADHKFWKVIRFDAFDAPFFRNLYQVYQCYQSILPDELRQHHLAPATLLFGELEVAVRMEFLDDTRQCREEEMKQEDVAKQVAEAVAFLGQNRLLYTDLRCPNILIQESIENEKHKVWLIDYDDMRIVDEPLTTMEAFRSKLCGLEGIPRENNFMLDENELFSVFQRCLEEILRQNV